MFCVSKSDIFAAQQTAVYAICVGPLYNVPVPISYHSGPGTDACYASYMLFSCKAKTGVGHSQSCISSSSCQHLECCVWPDR